MMKKMKMTKGQKYKGTREQKDTVIDIIEVL